MTAIKDSRDKRKTLGKSVTKLMNADAGEDEATALEAFTEAEKKINDGNQAYRSLTSSPFSPVAMLSAA